MVQNARNIDATCHVTIAVGFTGLFWVNSLLTYNTLVCTGGLFLTIFQEAKHSGVYLTL